MIPYVDNITFSTISADSADDKLIFFLFFPRNKQSLFSGKKNKTKIFQNEIFTQPSQFLL